MVGTREGISAAALLIPIACAYDVCMSPQSTLEECHLPSDPSPGWQARAQHLANTGPAEYAYAPKEKGMAIQKVRYSHDAMIDLIIQQPSVSQNSLAEVFGYTPPWVSQVMSSDAFKARLEARKEELVDPQIRLTLNEKFNALVSRSLDVLQEKLSQHQVDPAIALQAAALGAKALGLGGNAAPKSLTINTSDRLDQLAGRLTGLLQTKRNEVILDV